MTNKNLQSPLPKRKKINLPSTFTFPQAMEQVIDKKRITRLAWANGDYCLLLGQHLSIYTSGEFHTWIINDGDLLATDWTIVPTEAN